MSSVAIDEAISDVEADGTDSFLATREKLQALRVEMAAADIPSRLAYRVGLGLVAMVQGRAAWLDLKIEDADIVCYSELPAPECNVLWSCVTLGFYGPQPTEQWRIPRSDPRCNEKVCERLLKQLRKP